jgi:hypothetical protein
MQGTLAPNPNDGAFNATAGAVAQGTSFPIPLPGTPAPATLWLTLAGMGAILALRTLRKTTKAN